MAQDKLNELRTKIDSIDKEIIDLLNKRAELAAEVGKTKSGENMQVYHPGREKQVFDRLFELNKGRLFPDAALERIYAEIISVSRELQRPMRVAYLGPQATYTHMAVIKHFGSSVDTYAVDSISDIFKAVETDKCDYGVVPVENSTEGIVTHTYDQFIDSPVKVVSEVFMNVSHCLLSTCNDLNQIKKLYTHPQSIAQCRIWIQNNLKNVEMIETSSNAKAASIVAWDKYGAAIASEVAAGIYDLNILARNLEDNPENITRFLVVGREFCSTSGEDKTSLVCSVKDRPGALHDLLAAFSSRDINMTKIESRPTRKKAWEYLFFIDLDGHYEDKQVTDALKALEEHTQFLKVLGSYPRGRLIDS